jgi:hypothetical protein
MLILIYFVQDADFRLVELYGDYVLPAESYFVSKL